MTQGFDKRNLANILDLLGVEYAFDHNKNVREEIKAHAKKYPEVEQLLNVCIQFAHKKLGENTSFVNSATIFEAYKDYFNNQKQEHFIVLNLDNKHRLIKESFVSKGILNKSLVHPRECLTDAIHCRAAAVVLIHCHPSGDPKPSLADIDITKRLKLAGDIIGIPVIDHIVIGNGAYFSFIDEDIFPTE